jgi:3-oxoacyl-[acyl-carrier-protein] synthase-3
MQGRGVRDFVFDNVPGLIGKLLASAGTTAADVDCFIPHQANGVLVGELAARCGLEHAHRHQVVGKYGNLGSASVPVTLHDAIRHGCVSAGDLVLLAGFGGGMTAGACLLRWAAPATSTLASTVLANTAPANTVLANTVPAPDALNSPERGVSP